MWQKKQGIKELRPNNGQHTHFLITVASNGTEVMQSHYKTSKTKA